LLSFWGYDLLFGITATFLYVITLSQDFILPDSSPSDVSQKLKADYFLQFSRLEVIYLSSESNRPVVLQLLGTFGGQIMIWDIIHPHKVLTAWKSSAITEKDTRKLNRNIAMQSDLDQMVSQAVRGPDLLSNYGEFSGHSILEFIPLLQSGMRFIIARKVQKYMILLNSVPIDMKVTNSSIQTVLMMKGSTVEVIDAISGERLQSISLNNILDVAKESSLMQSLATTGVWNQDIKPVRIQESCEVRPTCVHFCSFSQFVLVGYQTGVVGVLNFHEPIYNSESTKKANYSYLRTNQVHDSDITLIKTFSFQFFPHSNVGISTLTVNDTSYQYLSTEIIVAVIGDSQGVLSLWQIHPQRCQHTHFHLLPTLLY
jgi:hypothetical protein